jgi:isopentenyl phosphate kinase
LSDAIPEDKLAVLKAKRRAQKRITIRTDVDDVADLQTVVDIESDGLQEILSRERIGRTRADVTKGTKDLSARLLPIFAMIKAKEEGKKNDLNKAALAKVRFLDSALEAVSTFLHYLSFIVDSCPGC